MCPVVGAVSSVLLVGRAAGVCRWWGSWVWNVGVVSGGGCFSDTLLGPEGSGRPPLLWGWVGWLGVSFLACAPVGVGVGLVGWLFVC